MKKVLICLLALVLTTAVNADLRLYMDFETIAENPGSPGTYDIIPDLSAYGNHGLMEAGFPGSSTELPSQVASVNGSNALLFGYDSGSAGSGWNSVAVAKADSIENLGNMFTLSAWIRQDSVGEWAGDYAYVMSTPNYGFQLNASGDPSSYFWPYDPDGAGATTQWDFAMAQTSSYYQTWMHMAITWDGDVFTQYINGSPVFTKSDFTEEFDTFNDSWRDGSGYWWENAPMRIGSDLNAGNARYLVGALDDVAIWGGEYLDAAGVSALANQTATPLTVPTVPEPATIALLSLGALLLRRKNK